MTALPIPRQPSHSANLKNHDAVAEMTPVFALKQLVARWHREQNKIQDLLSSLGFALRSFNNLNQFLELIPLMATRVTDADASALILFKPNGQVHLERLHCQEGSLCHDIRKALDVSTRHLGITPVSQDEEKSPVPASSFDDRVKQYLDQEIQIFSTPIPVQNTDRGYLYIFSCDPDYEWTETRGKLLRLVADQTAVAIANDELAVELRKKERLDRELEIGSDIQKQLLPRQCPEVCGIELAANCQTANRVGGDYYDFIPANYDQLGHRKKGSSQSGQWSIVIGDVMGKGVPAGLIMTMTRGMLRAEVLNGHSPGQILQHLNRVMYADLENSHRFVTLFYSEYDPKTRILSYSNAAHTPPLLWQAATDSLIRLDTFGMLIGLDANSEYEDAQIQLAPGDTIIYYTDGFTEAANHSGDRFEEENLSRAFQWACQHSFKPQAILDYLFDRIQQFIGPNNRNGDDMTLVVMQVKNS